MGGGHGYGYGHGGYEQGSLLFSYFFVSLLLILQHIISTLLSINEQLAKDYEVLSIRRLLKSWFHPRGESRQWACIHAEGQGN
jgi:hypothetical protein